MAQTLRQAKRKTVLNPRARKLGGRTLLYILLLLGGVVTCFPFVWMILTSFKTYAEAIATPPTFLPQDWASRLQLVGRLFRMYPLVPLLLLAWGGLGVWLARKFRDPVIGILYLLGHLAAFFLLGNLTSLGPMRLLQLWQQAMAKSGVQLTPLFGNYAEAWARAPFGYYFRNSIVISVATPLLIVLTSAPAAYAFARLRFPFRDALFMCYLATMMVPSEVLLIPNFITISQLGWKNTYWALIIPSAVSVLSIFFLRQFFRSIPNDLYDAATIDGCGHTRFLVAIAIPLSMPALVSTAMFNFLASWNALLWPLLVTDHANMRPIALGLASFSTEAAMQVNLYMAAATFSILPIIILFLFVQKQFIEGIARTGIK